MLHKSLITAAMKPGPWDLTNNVLYSLCSEHHRHKRSDEILAKVLLIGRGYAASMERRRKDPDDMRNFYLDVVVPNLKKSTIDRWIAKAKTTTLDSKDGLDFSIEIHGKTMALFNEISGLDKRSLASKYLHFHVPKVFLISNDPQPI